MDYFLVLNELFPQFLKIFYPKSNCSCRLGNKTIISCLIGKIGWGDVPGNCCPTIPQVFSPAVGEYFRLFPFKAWNNCIFIIVWKKKSTSLLFQSHSNPWTLSCHWNVILLSKHFFFRDPQVETLEPPSPSFLQACTVQTYLDTVPMSLVTVLN